MKSIKYWLSSATAIAAVLAFSPALAQSADEEQGDDAIIVTGVRASLVEGLNVKRNSTQVVESIVAEDIGKLPDNNVIEALQRVAGVQVTNRGGGEASAVIIRGLPDVVTTWNGRNIFTADGRALALQDIPSNLVSRIDVFKTRAADQLETGLAGQIDVATRRPFDFDGFQFSVAGRAIYQEQSEELDPNVSVLIGNRWRTSAGDFGALLNVSYARTRWRNQSITAGAMVPFATPDDPPAGYVPIERIFNTRGGVAENPIWQAGLDRGLPQTPGSTLTFNGVEHEYLLARDAMFAVDAEGDRHRPAVNAAFQWGPNPNATYTAEFFYQGYREDIFNNLHFTFADWWGALGSDPGSTIELFPGTNIIKSRTVGFPFGFQSGDSIDQKTDSYAYALNGDWRLSDRLNVTADLSYQDSEFETNFIAVRTERVPGSLQVDFNHNDGLPSWHFGEFDANEDGNPDLGAAFVNRDDLLLDPAQWTVGQLFQNRGRTSGDAVTLSIDGDLDLDLDGGGFFKKLSFGVRYDDRGAVNDQIGPQVEPFLGQNMSALPVSYRWTNSNFFDGQADVPTSWMVVNGNYLRDNKEEVRARWGAPVDGPQYVGGYDIQEKTLSAYAMLDMEATVAGRPLRAQVGLRYTDVESDLNFVDTITLDASSGDAQIDDVLPSATIYYDVTNDFRLRFNYGETLRRPNFGDVNPNLNLVTDLTSVGYGTGGGGNPDLEATTSKNYDLTFEWYFAPDSAVYGTWFRKEIEGLVLTLALQQEILGTGLIDPDGEPVTQFLVTRPFNASDGELEGFEIGLVYFPDYLPGVLDGLGVQASYTNLDSSQNVPLTDNAGNIVGQAQSEFFAVSPESFNVTLAYDRGGLGMRLSYVWRDEFLYDNEARIFANPIGRWRRPESSLDFQGSYNLNDHMAFTFDAVNLTEELEQSYYRFADAGSPQTTNFGNALFSRTFAVGFRYRY